MSPYNHYHHFSNHTSSISNAWGTFLGAFLGALFAFVFGVITYVITKRRERFIQHKNALVKAERMLNRHLNDLGTLEAIAMSMQKILSERKVDIARLFILQVPEGLDIEVASVELINELLTYQISVDRINFNISSVNHTLTRIEDLFISGNAVLDENFHLLIQLLDGLVRDLTKFNNETIRLLVLIRIHNYRLKNKNTYTHGVLKTIWEQAISEAEIMKERRRLEKEIQDAVEGYNTTKKS